MGDVLIKLLQFTLLCWSLMFFSLAVAAKANGLESGPTQTQIDTDIDKIYTAPLTAVGMGKVLRKFTSLYQGRVNSLVTVHEYGLYGRLYEVIFNPTLVKLNDQHVCRFNVFEIFYRRTGEVEFTFHEAEEKSNYWSHPFDAETHKSVKNICTEDKIEIKGIAFFSGERFVAAYKAYEKVLPYLSCWHPAPMQVEDMEKVLFKKEVLGAIWTSELHPFDDTDYKDQEMYVFALASSGQKSWKDEWAEDRKREETPLPRNINMSVNAPPYPYEMYVTLDGKQASYQGVLRTPLWPIEELKCDKDQAKRRQQPYPK